MGFYENLKGKGNGAKDWINSFTEVEYLGGDKFGASITTGNRVFKDKTDNKWKKHKLTDNSPDHVLVQSAKCCVEVYPYYAKYYDVNHEEVRLYEERWVIQRLFKEPDDWRDVDAYNPVVTVEEYSEPAGDVVKVTITYDTDYGVLTVEYFQRDGNALKHNVTFKNTSGSEETFRVLQRWAGIVGAKCNDKTTPVVEDAPFFAFHSTDKTKKKFNVAENLYSMVFNPDGTEKTDQCLQRPVSIDTHGQGMKTDFIYAKWVLSQNESLTIDPDTTTLDDPTQDGHIRNANNVTYTRFAADETIYFLYYVTIVDEWKRGFVEWNISQIPDRSTITKVEFRYHGYVNPITDNCYIYAMANQPSVQSDDNAGNQVIFDDAGDGTAYLSDNATFPAFGSGQDVGGDSGPPWDNDPKSDVQSALVNNWFAFGFKNSEVTNDDSAVLYSEEKTDAADPKPTLYIEYILPSVNPLIGKPLISPDIIKKAIIR